MGENILNQGHAEALVLSPSTMAFNQHNVQDPLSLHFRKNSTLMTKFWILLNVENLLTVKSYEKPA